jgi:uncharacterized protein YutE (UPF0331/DUF86 family)
MPVDDDVLKTRISEVRSTVSELLRLSSKSFMELNVDEKFSMRYNVVVLVESLVSLCTHIAAEAYAKTPMSYREAVRVVGERLGVVCVDDLESLVGLRNLLIHRYWTVEDERIYEGVKTNFKCVEKLLSRVEEAFLR